MSVTVLDESGAVMTPTVRAAWPGVRVSVRADMTHRCPVIDEADTGSIEISWYTTEWTLELHWLARYLEGWADTAITHEDLVRAVAVALAGEGVSRVRVTFTAETAGMSVRASGRAR